LLKHNIITFLYRVANYSPTSILLCLKMDRGCPFKI
jgi:hypothetical protein